MLEISRMMSIDILSLKKLKTSQLRYVPRPIRSSSPQRVVVSSPVLESRILAPIYKIIKYIPAFSHYEQHREQREQREHQEYIKIQNEH